MRRVFEMQNASGSLSPECQADLAPDAWRCILAPWAAPFVRTPWFALQSRFDHWQLSQELFLPCMQSSVQPYAPPFQPSTCTPAEDAAIERYGPAFMAQFSPLMAVPGTRNGAFIDACIIHGSTTSAIDGLTNHAAFEAWYAGSTAQQWWLMRCGDGANATAVGPCDTAAVCAPFP